MFSSMFNREIKFSPRVIIVQNRMKIKKEEKKNLNIVASCIITIIRRQSSEKLAKSANNYLFDYGIIINISISKSFSLSKL